MRCLFALLAMLIPFGTMSDAETSEFLGVGRLFTNDYLGDGRDRYQSGSYVRSYLRGPADWDGTEDTFRGSLGVDVTAIGPQTGVSRFQERAHDALDIAQVRFTDSQLGDNFYLGLTAEAAEVLPLSYGVTARPFAELLIGPEDIARVGADVYLGGSITDDLLIRDVTTGHLYQGRETDDAGFAFVVGADLAAVSDSVYLPEDRGAIASDRRGRVRAGVHWHSAGDTSVARSSSRGRKPQSMAKCLLT